MMVQEINQGIPGSSYCLEPITAIHIILPIQYANLPPARQDGAIILIANQHINHHLPAGISYQLADLYFLASFKPSTILFNI